MTPDQCFDVLGQLTLLLRLPLSCITVKPLLIQLTLEHNSVNKKKGRSEFLLTGTVTRVAKVLTKGRRVKRYLESGGEKLVLREKSCLLSAYI